ncbi:MAG: DUF4433 domain-containing protein [Bacteroidota bacterium]
MAIPDRIYLYRITHIDNLDFILESGKLTCPSHTDSNPNYIGIGDTTLIGSRSSKLIDIEPKGNFADYVAFYFGARSPMLYAIQNGFNGVTKRNPQEIVYLVSDLEKIKENDCRYIFTDGHGYHSMSQFFNSEDGLEEVDWNAVKLIHWTDTEDDPDRKRRKQAEFLVYRELPLAALIGIVVHSEAAKNRVLNKLAVHEFTYNVIVKSNWYY